MQNALEKALVDIRSEIPKEILDIVFGDNTMYSKRSMNDNILDNVVHRRVRADCNLMGGKSVQISLKIEYWERTNFDTSAINSGAGQFSLYRIPSEARMGAPITEVFHTQYPLPYGQALSAGYLQGGGDLCTTSDQLLQSHLASGQGPTPTPELLQGDLIRLHPGIMTHIQWVLACRVGYDENMTNLNGSALSTFSQLCVLATKSYIYNNLIVNLDRGFIQGGAEITSIKSIVEEWRDLNELYREVLDKYFGANVLDPIRIAPLLKYMM